MRVTLSSLCCFSQAEIHDAKRALFLLFLLMWGILKQSCVECSCTDVPLRGEGIKKKKSEDFGGNAED